MENAGSRPGRYANTLRDQPSPRLLRDCGRRYQIYLPSTHSKGVSMTSCMELIVDHV